MKKLKIRNNPRFAKIADHNKFTVDVVFMHPLVAREGSVYIDHLASQGSIFMEDLPEDLTSEELVQRIQIFNETHEETLVLVGKFEHYQMLLQTISELGHLTFAVVLTTVYKLYDHLKLVYESYSESIVEALPSFYETLVNEFRGYFGMAHFGYSIGEVLLLDGDIEEYLDLNGEHIVFHSLYDFNDDFHYSEIIRVHSADEVLTVDEFGGHMRMQLRSVRRGINKEAEANDIVEVDDLSEFDDSAEIES